MGKVRGSSKDFPYTEVRTSVLMADPYEQEKINKQIRKKEAERMLLKAEVDEVDEYIEAIGDSEIKRYLSWYLWKVRSSKRLQT